MKNYLSYAFLGFLIVAFLQSCSKKVVEIPATSVETMDMVAIYPDYQNVFIPVNIAPLNFQVLDECSEVICLLEGKNGQPLLVAGKDRKIQFPEEDWRNLLLVNKRSPLLVTLYTKSSDTWQKHPSFTILVAEEVIDAYLTYRLIEPGYELYHQMGIYQRNLTGFAEGPVYENSFDGENSHCVNCHNFQNYSTQNMMFHVRGAHGGTVFVQGGKVDKRVLTTDQTLGNAVYPSWHPTKPWLVYSSNMTSQSFHMQDLQKIEVIDHASDLLFYDAQKNEISNILKTNADLENFPTWAPDGSKIFYCKAYVPELEDVDVKETNRRQAIIMDHYNSIHYDLMSMPFDGATMSWGEPQVEMNCSADSLSASVPRVSPDGRYVLFTLGRFGQFHIWHQSSDLYLKDLESGEVRPLKNANSTEADSYHGWSSNGRWIVFASRRDDGNYSRLYISYFDKNGKEHKPFLLPQRDPEQNLLRLKSYNVPEFTQDRVEVTSAKFKQIIFQDEPIVKAKYK